MSILFRVAAATEIILVCAEGVLPSASSFLPLGGSHVAQLGLLFGPAFVLDEWIEALLHAFRPVLRILRMSHERARRVLERLLNKTSK